ncbi:hypothetical protein COU79_05400 [Candidatus Peregrinibacteria bacterium CG10_big_fil_rev_8_21_14_0_10_54_7]|nr:MAG: hypothetical protein COU79_05400 [Candidatus Peregrinibacteria bacterium CG10_big_fil_rev_8_21_14_0_10_54_7]
MALSLPDSGQHLDPTSALPPLPPDVDLTCGGQLQPGGHRIREILHDDSDHLPLWQSGKIILEALNRAGYKYHEMPRMLYRLARLYMQASVPHDTEVICEADEYAEKVVLEFIGRFVREGSCLHGRDHLVQAMDMNRQGKSVQFYCMPHLSAMDPIFLKILLQREAEGTNVRPHQEAAEQMFNQLIVLIGHKVLHNRFRRAFSQAVNAVFTIPPKYRADLEPEVKQLLATHSWNVGHIVEALRSDPRWAMFLCPEGGFTRERQLGIQTMTAQVPSDTYIAPIFTDEPEGFMRHDLGEAMNMEPSPVHMFFGKPFQLEPGGRRQRVSALITTCRNNCAAVGAPVRKYRWGYMKRSLDEESGQEFVEIG